MKASHSPDIYHVLFFSDFLTFWNGFHFQYGFLSVASIFWLKHKSKSLAKTMVFESSREKSGKSRSTSLSAYICSVSEFELYKFNKISVSVLVSASTIRTLLLLSLQILLTGKLFITKVTNRYTTRICCTMRKKIPLL